MSADHGLHASDSLLLVLVGGPLLGQLPLLGLDVVGVVPVVDAQAMGQLIQLQDPFHHPVEEGPVVGHNEDGPLVPLKKILQPLQGPATVEGYAGVIAFYRRYEAIAVGEHELDDSVDIQRSYGEVDVVCYARAIVQAQRQSADKNGRNAAFVEQAQKLLLVGHVRLPGNFFLK